MRSRTLRDSRTPSAAVGSSRITTLRANTVARATAIACRWPPDISATGASKFGSFTLSRSSTAAASRSMARPLRKPQAVRQPGREGDLAAAIEVLRRRQVVEQREVLVDGLDAGAARRARRVERDRLAVEKDLAFVEGVDAADALHQRRLAGAVVAEKRQHLAAIGLEAHVLQRMHRAEALLRVADGEDRCGRARSLRPRRLQGARPRLEMVAQHIRLDRHHDDQADGDHLEEDVDVEQVERVADDADHHRADERVADMAAPAEEARAADDHRGDRVELEQVAVERRARRRCGRQARWRRSRRRGRR